MALDGLSNQNVGIYRTKDPSKTTDKLEAKSKEKAEIYLADIEDSALIEKVDPDAKGNQNQGQLSNELILSKTNQLIENEDDEQVLELKIDDGNSTQELLYTIKFNSQTKMIEMKNVQTNELIETVHPDELLKVLHKAKNFSGMFVDKEI